MTETQATAGMAKAPSGSSGKPGEGGGGAGGAAGKGAEAANPDKSANPAGDPAKVVVGRASVPGDKPGAGPASAVSAPADKPASEVRVTAEPPSAPDAKSAGRPSERPGDVQSVLAAAGRPADAAAGRPAEATVGRPADAAAGRPAEAAVGRPADAADKPKFTRAPGMQPPPDSITPEQPAGPRTPPAKASGTAKVATGIATGVAAARNPVSAEATVGIRVPTAPNMPPEVTSAMGTAAPATGSARVQDGSRTGRIGAPANRGSRRARLHLKRVDPWSVMKFSFAVSLVLFIVIVIATAVLYVALDTMGVFEAINKAIGQVDPTGSSGGVKISASGVLLAAVLIGGVNTVLFTALATLGAFIYNVCADLVGGIELTLAEKD